MVIANPDVLEAITASGRAARSMAARTPRLTGPSSGEFSCTMSAPDTAAARSAWKLSRSGPAPARSPIRSSSGQVSSSTRSRSRWAPGAVPGEGMVGPVNLHEPTGPPGAGPQPPGVLYWYPRVVAAVHDQQRPRRDRRDDLQRSRPPADVRALARELLCRHGQEAGHLVVDLIEGEIDGTEVAGCSVDGDGPRPLVGGRREDGGPAAEAVAHDGQPPRVHGRVLARLQVVDRGGHVARDRAQVVTPLAAPAAAVMEHQRVPAAVAQRCREVEVLLQARAAVQQQDRRLRRLAASEVQRTDQPVPAAVEGDTRHALMLTRRRRRLSAPPPVSSRRSPGPSGRAPAAPPPGSRSPGKGPPGCRGSCAPGRHWTRPAGPCRGRGCPPGPRGRASPRLRPRSRCPSGSGQP